MLYRWQVEGLEEELEKLRQRLRDCTCGAADAPPTDSDDAAALHSHPEHSNPARPSPSYSKILTGRWKSMPA